MQITIAEDLELEAVKDIEAVILRGLDPYTETQQSLVIYAEELKKLVAALEKAALWLAG